MQPSTHWCFRESGGVDPDNNANMIHDPHIWRSVVKHGTYIHSPTPTALSTSRSTTYSKNYPESQALNLSKLTSNLKPSQTLSFN